MYKYAGFTKYTRFENFKGSNHLADIRVEACAKIMKVCCHVRNRKRLSQYRAQSNKK